MSVTEGWTVPLSASEKTSKVYFKSNNLDLYKDNYISFTTAGPITSAEGIAIFISDTDMYDSNEFVRDSFAAMTSGYGLGILPNINGLDDNVALSPFGGAGTPLLWQFSDPTSVTTLVSVSGLPRAKFLPVFWGDGFTNNTYNDPTTNYQTLTHTYDPSKTRVRPYLNHIASVAIDGRGGYGLRGFAFTSGGNDYLTPYSITNRILTDSLSSKARGRDEPFSVATHCNTTASLPILSTGYSQVPGKVTYTPNTSAAYFSQGLSFRIKFSAFLTNVRVDLLSGGEYINLASLSTIDLNSRGASETYLNKFPRYGRIGFAYSGNLNAFDGNIDITDQTFYHPADGEGILAGSLTEVDSETIRFTRTSGLSLESSYPFFSIISTSIGTATHAPDDLKDTALGYAMKGFNFTETTFDFKKPPISFNVADIAGSNVFIRQMKTAYYVGQGIKDISLNLG
jgi:hypothetical protein